MALTANVKSVESWHALAMKTCVIGEEKYPSCRIHSVLRFEFDILLYVDCVLVVGDFKVAGKPCLLAVGRATALALENDFRIKAMRTLVTY